MMYRKWSVNEYSIEKSVELSGKIGAGRLLCDVLVSRGYETPEDAGRLLAEGEPLSDPYLLKDMDKAVERIRAAIEADETIVVFGDYDADGVTATALLYSCLESLGAQVYYKLPNRSDDDYGLSVKLVEQVAELGISLIITVDNGTLAFEAANRAAQLGIDVVITDHHLPGDTLPDVAALINPHRQDDSSPLGHLSGVGVAFMLASALESCEPAELLPVFGDLVALGTVADVMPLVGDNRTLVKTGLEVMRDTERPGLAALIDSCGFKGKNISAENISYALCPRLNAAGRMDDPTIALNLLLAQSEEEAEPIILCLQEQNTARQKAEQDIVEEIIADIAGNPAITGSRILVVAGDNWHSGVVGIVASRLVERFAKPAIVISFDGDEGRGSGRSFAGFMLHAAIASCEDLMIRFGGHDLAAGLSIKRSNLEEFRRRVNEWAQTNNPNPQLPELNADILLAPEYLNVQEVRQLEKMAPFGSGNPMPKFMIQNAKIEAVYPVGEGRHSRLRLAFGGQTLYTVLFGAGPDKLAYKQGDEIDALVTLSVYEGRGDAQVSSRIVEMRPAGMGEQHVEQSVLFQEFTAGSAPTADQISILSPTREDTAAVYRVLRDEGGIPYTDLRPVFARLGENITGKLLTSLAALEELGLVSRDEQNECYKIVSVKEKKDLAASSLLRRLEV